MSARKARNARTAAKTELSSLKFMIKQAVAAPGLAILYTGVVDALTRSGRFSALDIVAPGMPVCHALRRGGARVTHL